LNARISAELERMQRHIDHPQNRQLLNAVLLQMFDLAVNVEGVYWSVSKPLLPIILISQNEFKQIQQIMIERFSLLFSLAPRFSFSDRIGISSQASVDASKASHLNELFGELSRDVQMNLEPQNREKFTSNLTNFRFDLPPSSIESILSSLFILGWTSSLSSTSTLSTRQLSTSPRSRSSITPWPLHF